MVVLARQQKVKISQEINKNTKIGEMGFKKTQKMINTSKLKLHFKNYLITT